MTAMSDLADVVAASGLRDSLRIGDLIALRAGTAALRAAVRTPLLAALVTHFEQPDVCKRAPTLRLLATVSVGGDARTAKLAAQLQHNVSADIRHAAVLTFVSAVPGLDEKARREMSTSCLRAALLDKDSRVCTAAAKCLPRLVTSGDALTIAVASRCLRHAAAGGRRSAIMTLAEVARRGDAVLVAKVAAAAEHDSEWEVRAAACLALPRLADRGDEVAQRALQHCMGDEREHVRLVAVGAMPHISARPTQHFLTWAPDRNADAKRKSGHAARRGKPQQRMVIESPAGLGPPPAQRRRISGH